MIVKLFFCKSTSQTIVAALILIITAFVFIIFACNEHTDAFDILDGS